MSKGGVSAAYKLLKEAEPRIHIVKSTSVAKGEALVLYHDNEAADGGLDVKPSKSGAINKVATNLNIYGGVLQMAFKAASLGGRLYYSPEGKRVDTLMMGIESNDVQFGKLHTKLDQIVEEIRRGSPGGGGGPIKGGEAEIGGEAENDGDVDISQLF